MKDNNYLRARKAEAKAASFQKRTAERALVWAGAAYLVAMAVFLVLGSMGVVPGANGQLVGGGQVGYVALYAVVSVAVAAYAAFVAFRWIVPGRPDRKVTFSLIGVVVFALVTFDTVALLVFGLALGFYVTKDRAPKAAGSRGGNAGRK
ncbi:hypothetical protein [Bifidobacterium platyrrhinorum]|uniref:DUF4064 domain-containing protein n=1 Tax=Bifidobacterium platyrrhinorum TaxID=2661628 RepID=A0A6L9STM3_9BIFI|nr:hypothetical protein [Bifidobacterium platyrrhinorum]NEG54892.1 hypothetical protein [Bifidobacterium platyrrhinorum]